MATIGELWVKLKGDTNDFENKMDGAKNKAESFEKSFKGKVGETMVSVGKTMTMTGAAIVTSMAGIVMAGADWSAQVEGQKFLYNNLDQAIQKSIDKNSQHAESIGLTSQQYKNGATTMATFYKNMGFTTEATTKLSSETMNLVADLAAVTDMPFDEAMDRFKSGLMGNYEALDAFGINISAASLESSEYVKSLGKTWNQLSDNEKMQAVYNEITRQGASANGLAKQEADSFAMKMKLLKQQLKETVGTIGEKLLPVLQPLVDKFVECAKAVADWANKHPQLTQTILIVVGGLGLFMAIVGPLVMVIGTLIIAVGTFNVAMLPVIGTVMAVIAVIALLVAGGIALWQNWDTLKAKVTELKNDLIQKWDELKNKVLQKANELKEKAVQYIKDKINKIVSTMQALPDKIKDAWERAKQGMIQKAQQMIGSAKAKIQEKVNAVGTKARDIKGKIQDAWNNATSYLKSINLFSIGTSLMQGLVDGIKSMGSSIVNAVKGGVQAAIDKAKSLLKINSPSKVFKEIGMFTGQGLVEGIEGENKSVLKASESLSKSVVGGYNANISTNFANGLNTDISNSTTKKDTSKEAIAIFNVDGREFMRAIAPYKYELDKYDVRNPRFSY